MERPLFLPLLSAVTGLFVADLYHFFLPGFSIYLFLAASLPLIFTGKRPFFLFVLSLFFFSWGNLSLKPYLERQSPADDVGHFASGDKYAIEGVIDERPAAWDRGSKIFLRCERLHRGNGYAEVSGRLLLYVGEGRVDFRTGDRIRFVSRIRKPRNFGIPGEFDYVRYLAYREVFSTAFAPDSRDVVLVRRKAGYSMQSAIDGVAGRIGRFISARAPGEEGFVLRALLLGDGGSIAKETKDAYGKAGVNHILSISGFHVGVVSLFIFYLLLTAARGSRLLLLHVNVRRMILVLTLPAILFFLFLSGAAPATVRSTVMISAYIIAMLLEREVDALNSLMIAAMAILCCNPAALFDLSFQFSFLALWGIVVLTPLLLAPFRRMEGTVAYKLLAFLMVSLSATMVTLLPVAHYFQRVTFTGVISNFFIVPLLGYGAVMVGFAALPFVFCFPALASLLIRVAAFLVKISDEIIFRLAGLPTITPLIPDQFDFFCFFAFLLAVTFVNRVKLKLVLGGVPVFLFALVNMTGSVYKGADDSLRITFFSVGQGESTLVSFPNGKRMLIDGGGGFRDGGMDVGERLLAPALRRMGCDRLDYVVLTHAHPDHVKGLRFIIENFPVGEFWENGMSTTSKDYADIMRILAEKKVPTRLFHASVGTIKIGETSIEPVSPRPGKLSTAGRNSCSCGDENECSLVFRLSHGDFSMLFTGDIGFATESMLAGQGLRLASTVLKVPHHGSRHSSSEDFLRAVAPQAALVSAGYGNSFGLPSERTLALLRRRGIKIFRTDLDGTIEVRNGKDGWNVTGYRENGHFH